MMQSRTDCIRRIVQREQRRNSEEPLVRRDDSQDKKAQKTQSGDKDVHLFPEHLPRYCFMKNGPFVLINTTMRKARQFASP
jgi:hypothetical protein